MTPPELLDAALERVESRSIRAWASTAHNRPLLLELAATMAADDQAPIKLATFIVSAAIGL